MTMHHYSEIEAFYNKYLKYAVRITKNANNTLTLGELGRFPIQIKATVSAVYTILAETCTCYREHYVKCRFSVYEK